MFNCKNVHDFELFAKEMALYVSQLRLVKRVVIEVDRFAFCELPNTNL